MNFYLKECVDWNS